MKNMYDYYYNVETEEGTCVTPEGVVPKTSWLTGEEIQVGGWNICFYCKCSINIWEREQGMAILGEEAVLGDTEDHFSSVSASDKSSNLSLSRQW